MKFTPSFLGRVQEICRDIDHTRTLEALHESLPCHLAKIGGTQANDAGASAFMVIAKYSVAGHTFQIANGAGRYSNFLSDWLTGHVVREDMLMKPLLQKYDYKFWPGIWSMRAQPARNNFEQRQGEQ